MSDEALQESGWWQQLWRRLAYTPLKDWSRGRLTAQLDLNNLVARSELPEELKTIVYKTARRARLWRGERIDAALELVNHFTDGLQAGHSVAELRDSFGDRKLAARLISRAKRRARPIWLRIAWPIVKFAGFTIAVFLLLTGVAVARYLLVRPIADTSFTDSLNERARSVGEADRAWPLYSRAFWQIVRDVPPSTGYDPGSRRSTAIDWPELTDYAYTHEAIATGVREASGRPKLGYYFGRSNGGDDVSEDLLVVRANQFSPVNRYMSLRFSPLEPFVRTLVQLMQADAMVAVKEGSADRAIADVKAMFAMSDQSLDGFPLIGAYETRFEILIDALRTVADMLVVNVGAFSDDQLRELARAIGSLSDEILAVDLTTQHKVWEESLTHSYAADGFLTAQGLRNTQTDDALISGIAALQGTGERAGNRLVGLVADAWIALAAVNLGAVEKYGEELRAQTQDFLNSAPWERKTDSWATLQNDELFHKTIRNRWRPAVDALQLYGWEGKALDFWRQQALQQRDAMLAVIALQLYHRAHHVWPKSLDTLVPEYLSAVPLDRFDGKPLRYAVRDDRPLIYSVGTDRIDDGGNSPSDDGARDFEIQRWRTSEEGKRYREQSPLNVGDWVLWPPPEATKPEMGERD